MLCPRFARSFLTQDLTGSHSLEMLDALQLPQNPRQPPKVLSRDEIYKLIHAASRVETPRAIRDFAVLSLLYATGLRATEVIALDVDDIDLQDGFIRTSPSRPEPISLAGAHKPVQAYIEKGRPYLLRASDVQALFVNQRGKRLSRQGLWLIVKRWASEVGLSSDISPQTIRHSLVRHLLEQGKSRSEVQALLRLSSPNTLWLHKRSENG